MRDAQRDSGHKGDEGFGLARRRARTLAAFAALAALLALLVAANLCWGSLAIPPRELVAILAGAERQSIFYQVIWDIRLPRLVMAALLGAALSLAGFLLQTFFRNPIAGPYILGISHGAKLAVALVMIAVVGSRAVMASWVLVLAAFVGSLAAMACVLAAAQRVRSASTLIVVGVMVGYVCNAATEFLVTFASDANIVNLRSWAQGSFSGATWHDVGVIAVVVLAVSAGVFALSKPLGAFQLGEGYAHSVGVNVAVFRVALIVLSSLLAACVTAFAGPVSFVGIAVPHMVKRLLGTSKPLYVVPACLLGGASFCLLSDLIARTAFAPTELSLSAVTAVLGAPVVIALLLGRQAREGL